MIYLMKKGLNYKFAHISAFASNKPLKVDKNLTLSAQRALNRRVSIIIGKTHEY